ncbi:MAG TPA: YtxH domain-containing protein [Gemmataceae bacterium]|nr:YtxH domain-containing protein [Gemmataceae bacterium]
MLELNTATLRAAWRLVMLSKDRNAVQFIAGIGFGFAAGCLLGILYAPQAGKKTRRHLAHAVEDGVDYVASRAQDTTEYIRKGASHLQDEARDLLDRGQTVIEKGKARVEDAIETGRHLYRAAAR